MNFATSMPDSPVIRPFRMSIFSLVIPILLYSLCTLFVLKMEGTSENRVVHNLSWGVVVCSYEHPVVLPHVSHFMQVPFRTSVKFAHSPHISPS